MCEDFVKDGFKYTKPVRDEYESCKEESRFLNSDAVWNSYYSIMSKKYECSNFQDFKKRQTTSIRDSVIPAIDMYKEQVCDWFRELSSNVPLQNLGRRIPFFKDKEESLHELLSNKVPITRALWFINISVIQSTAFAETAKKKPRAPQDPTAEWSSTLCRMLSRSLEPIYSPIKHNELISLFNEWDYLFSLLVAMYDSDMADHWEVILWLIKVAESVHEQVRGQSTLSGVTLSPPNRSTFASKCASDSPLKFILHYLIKFGRRFTESELLIRRLLYWCCTTFSDVVFVCTGSKYTPSVSTLQGILNEYKDLCTCPLHRTISQSLSSLIIFIVLSCPSAAVWNPLPFDTEHSYFKGSPLDHIPHSLVALPLPCGEESLLVRKCLSEVEEDIIRRSQLVESGWLIEPCSGNNGENVERLVRLLEVLDRHEYHLVREPNPMESLYNRIFNDDSIHVDTATIVITLCEWAVSPYHNCTVQLPPFNGEQSLIENDLMRNLVCLFSELIDREVFDHDNYVRYFIARGVFDTSLHPLALSDNTMQNRMNINGNLTNQSVNTPTNVSRSTTTGANITSSTTCHSQTTAQHSVKSEFSEDMDRYSMDNPDSVRSESGINIMSLQLSSNTNILLNNNNTFTTIQHQTSNNHLPIGSTYSNRHLHYLIQFPIPQDESYAHEQNQRFQLLYGSVRSRDRARYPIRKLVRDICKLFTKKIYLIDVNTNDEARSIDEVHEDITKRFVNLSFYDMEYVLSQCTPVFVKMLNGSTCHSTINASNEDNNLNVASFNTNSPSSSTSTNTQSNNNNSFVTASTNNNGSNHCSMSTSSIQSHIYMPVPSSIFLFFELIETSLNITSLILTVIDTLERLKILFENRTHFMTLYMSSLCLRSVGILQRYQNILFTMGDISSRLFPTLIEQVRQVKEPTQCGPLERCILIYLNDLFTSNVVIKTRFTPIYGKAHQKVNALLRRVDPNEGMGQFDIDYGNDIMNTTSMDNVTLFRAYAEDLRNKPDSRYSFVCKAIIWICQAKTLERVNYLCGLCAELTSQCSELTPEWLGAFYAILAPHSYVHGYSPLINMIEPSQTWIYDNLSSLIGTLLSRYCFTISDFLRLVICPAMAQGLDNVTQPVSTQLESIISLACHILHCLFTAELTSSLNSSFSSITSPPFRISEPLLLTAALQKVTSEFLVDVLKMLIVHSDKASVDSGSLQEETLDEGDCGNDDNNHHEDSEGNCDDEGGGDEDDNDLIEDHDVGGGGALNGQDIVDELTDIDSEGDVSGMRYTSTARKRTRPPSTTSQQKGGNKMKRFKTSRRRHRQHNNNRKSSQVHYIVQRFLEQDILPSTTELRSLPLNALTQLVLREICTVAWVRERFHQMTPNQLIRENVLIDKNFTQSQARRLLHIIYWPYDLSWTDIASTYEGLSGAMCHMLHDLNIWTLKCTQIEFQLLYAQISFSQQGEVLGYLAQSIVQGFQSQIVNWLDFNNNSNNNTITNTTSASSNNNYVNFQEGSIGHLIDDLPIIELDDNDPVWLFPSLIAKLPKSLKAQVVKVTSEHKNDEDKESVLLQNSILLCHPTFLSLLQVCLPDADFLIDSLYEQIEYFVLNARNIADRVPDNLHTRQIVQQCLQYRLILVGQKFHYIQSDTDICTRWATLLAQLISHGVTEPESNSTLFYMVYDMLQILIHTLAARSGVEGKHYQSVAKKIRRELCERPPCSGIEYLRPLLLLTKGSYTVFVTGRQSRQSRGGWSNTSSGSLGGGGNSGTGSNSLGKLSGAGGGGGHSCGSGGSSSNKSSNSKGSGKAGSGGSRFFSSSNSINHQSGTFRGTGQLKKHGYQLLGKERFTPWEIYDPSKQPLLLSIHGAVNTESVLSRVEEQANRLIRHDHFHRISRPPEFYMVPIYPQALDEQSVGNSKQQCDVVEQENVNIMKVIKTENFCNHNDNIDNTNNAAINSMFVKNNNNNSQSMDIMRESQILSLNDMAHMSETNLSECSNQFTPTGRHTNTINSNNISGRVDSSCNYNQSIGVLYDQKHNMFNESNQSIKNNKIDCGNPNVTMVISSTSATITHTAANSSMQLVHGKMLNSRNDIDINDKLSFNNPMNSFHSSSSGTFGGTGGLPSSTSSSIPMHSHPQQMHAHQPHMLLSSDQAYTSMHKLSAQQNLMMNDYPVVNELDQRSMNSSSINHPAHIMNTITYPPNHHHNHQLDGNLHKTNKLVVGMEYNDRLIASQSSTSQQQMQPNNPGSAVAVPSVPPNSTMVSSTPMNSSVIPGHAMPTTATTAKTASTTTKRKRGSGRRGGGGNITSDRNSMRGGSARGGGMHSTTGPMNVVGYDRMNSNNTSSVNLYSYNVINPEQQQQHVGESSHQWNNNAKQNPYSMNLLEMQQQTHLQQPLSSTRGQHHHHPQQHHLVNLSGFLRNRAQQQQRQHLQQHHPGQSCASGFNSSNSVVVPHQGHAFDQSQLNNNQFNNHPNTHLADNPSGSFRRHLTAGNNRPMQQSSQQQPGMPNPPPYPIPNQSQQYSYRVPPDEASYMMSVNEPGVVDEQFKRQSINSVMNPIHHQSGTIMSRSSVYESPASHIQTDIQQQQQSMSYMPSQTIHPRAINQSQQQQPQSSQMIRSDMTATTVMNTANNNNSQQSHMSSSIPPHSSSYPRYTGY
ncbi:Mediator of RNA polymerase II transcription subunit 12 [Schistosoma japonicum]|nr:Mediator of RNA polymerase II transcription subunit 12 [Schistosoma japonicum]